MARGLLDVETLRNESELIQKGFLKEVNLELGSDFSEFLFPHGNGDKTTLEFGEISFINPF